MDPVSLQGVINLAQQSQGAQIGKSTVGFLGNVLNQFAADMRAKKQRQWSEQMMDKQNQFSLDMWNLTNEYNTPAAQRERLEAAGLNPLFFGLDGQSAQGFESAQPLGYQRASDSISNPIEAALQYRLAEAQINKINAETLRAKSETDATTLDNEFKRLTMDLRVRGEELKNSLSDSQIKKIDSEREQISVSVAKLKAETDTETERLFLLQAETNLKHLQAQQIVELLPLQQLNLQADTEQKRAMAALSSVQRMYQVGLLDAGYIDKLCNQMEATADSADATAAINRWKHNVKTGSALPVDETQSVVSRVGLQFYNKLFQLTSTLTEAIAGPLGGIVGK